MSLSFDNLGKREQSLFTDHIIAELAKGEGKYWRIYRVNGTEVSGVSVSDLKATMYEHGWKSLGSNTQFEWLCEAANFKVVRGQNQRGHWAQVVTI